MDFCGFLIMMEIPKDMKGLEKSITSSRTRVIVRGATAISAFWWREKDSESVGHCDLLMDLSWLMGRGGVWCEAYSTA